MRPALVESVVAAVACTLRLYPARFRRRFEREILRSVRREVEDALQRGWLAFAGASIREIVEAVSGVVPQHRLERARGRATIKERFMHLLESTIADLKMALRSLKFSNTVTVVAVIILALGIGATTAIFSVVDAAVLRQLPFDEPHRLAAVGDRRPPNAPPAGPSVDPLLLRPFAPQNYLDWAAQQQVFESIAAVAGGAFTLNPPGAPPEELTGLRVTAEFFDVLRVRPAIGRVFTSDNEVAGNHRVALISDGMWRGRFGADPAIVGQTIPLDSGPHEVAGVMPPDFEYPVGAVRPTEMWVPYVVPATERIRDPNTFSAYLGSIARLKPGVTIEQANANLEQIGAALRVAHPQWNQGSYPGARPLRDHIVGARAKSWMLMLLGAVMMVLLIACANVANLLLARATAREREIGIRAAIGAGRARLITQLMLESLALSAVGTVAGVLLAWWSLGILRTSMMQLVPRATHIALDLRVLGAAATLSLLTAIIFGIVPALRLSRPNLTAVLGEGGRGASSGRARQRLRAGLVVAEVTLSVVLLVGAALFIGSFRMLMKINPGFDPRNVVTASVQPRVTGPGVNTPGGSVSVTGAAPSPSRPPTDFGPLYQQMIDRLRHAPGVRYAAAVSGGTPLGGSLTTTLMSVPGKEQPDPIAVRSVTPDYLKAMGMTLAAGRHLEPADGPGALPVVLLNDSAARQYFPAGDALGKTVTLNRVERTIVGIVGDVYQNSLETAPRTEAYMPFAQSRVVFAQLVAKTDDGAEDVVAAMRAAVQSAMPGVPLRSIRTMEATVGGRIAQRRLNMLLLSLFGLLGLAISAAGIYGVMAYVVSQRTREIGVRMALGATQGKMLGMVLRNAASLVAIGLVIGGLCAWYLSATVKSFLFRIEPTDPRAFALALVALGVVALAASVIPARRAARVDPVIALRA